MSLSHAILTSLLEKPCTGAELARRFDKSLGYFWAATHQQIYRELGKMERNGQVETVDLPTSRGRQRQFRVKDDGRTELAKWCASPGEPRPIRDELLVRMRASAVLGTVNVATELSRHQELHAQSLENFRAIEARDFPPSVERGRAEALQLAVVRAGIAYEQSWLAWCEQSLADLAGPSH